MGSKDLATLLAALGLFGALLFVTTIPGVFTIDENNYMATVVALRDGGVRLENTRGLPASPELAYFDPLELPNRDYSTPTPTAAPPLYAPLALPFSVFGFRGLIALNTGALLLSALLVALLVFRLCKRRGSAFFAAYLVCCGGYAIEYAQGAWPHMLSMLLCFVTYLLVLRSLRGAGLWVACLAGLCIGTAAGIRYQNAASAVAFAAALAFFGDEPVGLRAWLGAPLRRVASFALGTLPAFSSASLINAARSGMANPVAKDAYYLKGAYSNTAPSWILEVLQTGWARVVDHTAHGPLKASVKYVRFAHDSGAMVVGGALKKAWLQSMPWAIVSLLVLALAFRRSAPAGERRQALRVAGLLVGATLVVFALSGFRKFDGFCFNQRYFLELLPWAAMALALGLEGARIQRQAMLLGVLGVGLVVRFGMPGPVLYQEFTLWMTLRGSLLIALACLVGYLWPQGKLRPALLGASLGAALAWSLGIHLTEDLPASRAIRALNHETLEHTRHVLPVGAGLFAYWGSADAFGPLTLEHDTIVMDTHRDDAASVPALRDALFAKGRRVFMVHTLPPEHRSALVGDHALREYPAPDGLSMTEVLP